MMVGLQWAECVRRRRVSAGVRTLTALPAPSCCKRCPWSASSLDKSSTLSPLPPLQGAFGEVQRVLVTPVSGPAFEAARKRIPACSVVARKMFAVEVNALKEGMGCTNVVQLLDYRTTATHHEILLELLRGGMLGDELVSRAHKDEPGSGHLNRHLDGGERWGAGLDRLATGRRAGVQEYLSG